MLRLLLLPAASPAKAYADTASFAARVSLDSTTESPHMMQRVRKRATKTFMNTDTTPSTKKRAKRIRQRCIDDDEDIKTGIEDMEPADSQEAYNVADMIVADADE